MDEIQIFKSKEFGNVRTLMFNNEPYLVGKDVAVALGYACLLYTSDAADD